MLMVVPQCHDTISRLKLLASLNKLVIRAFCVAAVVGPGVEAPKRLRAVVLREDLLGALTRSVERVSLEVVALRGCRCHAGCGGNDHRDRKLNQHRHGSLLRKNSSVSLRVCSPTELGL